MGGEIIIIGSFGSILTLIVGVFIRHTFNLRRHPDGDKLVYVDTCKSREDLNTQSHLHLAEGIEKAIGRSDEQHVELKQYVKEGFTELKELYRKG